MPPSPSPESEPQHLEPLPAGPYEGLADEPGATRAQVRAALALTLALGAGSALAAPEQPPRTVLPWAKQGSPPAAPLAPAPTQAHAVEIPAWIPNFKVTPDAMRLAEETLAKALASRRVRKHAPDAAARRAHLFALITKESHFDPSLVSSSGARGYGQVLEIARKEVNRRYRLSEKQGTHPEDLALSPGDLHDPVQNLECAAMHYEGLRERARQLFPNEHDEGKITLISDALYNGGDGNIRKLLDPGDTYDSFMLRTGRALAAALGGSDRFLTVVFDRDYGVHYTAFPGVQSYVGLYHQGERASDISIRGVDALKVGQILRYPELIAALEREQTRDRAMLEAYMRGGGPALYAEAARAVAAQATLPSATSAVKKPPRVAPPVPAALPAGAVVERITHEHTLYAIANQLQPRLIGQIPGYTREDFEDYDTRSEARDEIEVALMRYNSAISPPFKELEIDDGYSNFPPDTPIVIPPANMLKPYIEAIRNEGKQEEQVARESAREAPPMPTTRLYVDPALDAAGLKRIPKSPRPDIIPATVLPANLRVRASTTLIVWHSTGNGPHENSMAVLAGIKSKHSAHFFIARDGTIYSVVPVIYSIDHAGRMSNATRKAMWNGETNVSGHSIGIEVEAPVGMQWTKAQNASAKLLGYYLGGENKLRFCDQVDHSKVAVSQYLARGRKPDPYGHDWAAMDFPNNDLLLDQDVIRGIIHSNLDRIRKSSDWIRLGPRSEKRDDTLDGLIASERIWQERKAAGAKPAPMPRIEGPSPKPKKSLKHPPKQNRQGKLQPQRRSGNRRAQGVRDARQDGRRR